MSAYAITKQHVNSGSEVKPHAIFFGSAKELKVLLHRLNMRSRTYVYWGIRVRRITINGNLV